MGVAHGDFNVSGRLYFQGLVRSRNDTPHNLEASSTDI
jgi:hypothetical protein